MWCILIFQKRRRCYEGDSFAEVESVKAVSDVYAPMNGTIVAVNEALSDTPELINQDPFGEGWMIKIKLEDAASYENLMDAQDTRQLRRVDFDKLIHKELYQLFICLGPNRLRLVVKNRE